jgi:HEAT repeat protein
MFLAGCNGALPAPIEGPAAVSLDDLVPDATRVVRRALAEPDPVIRVNAIEVVATTAQIAFMPEVQKLLNDEFVPVRFAAALAMGDTKYALAARHLRALLNDQDENIRIAAAYGLYKLGSAESFEIIAKAVNSDNQSVRANAALLLGKTGDQRALRFLWWTLRREDSNYKVRFQAIEAIAMLGDDNIMTKLWPTLYSGYVDDRIMGVRAVGALKSQKAKEILITKLDDEALEVRLAAAERLGILGDKTGEPEVLDVFRKNLTRGLGGRVLERINVFTALAIGSVGTPRLTKFLPRFLQDASPAVRLAAAKSVFHLTRGAQPGGKLPI